MTGPNADDPDAAHPDEDHPPAERGEAGGRARSPLTRAQARDELLARLAAQVRTTHAATERRLDTVEANVAESADLLGQALPRIDTALDQLAALTQRLDDEPTAPVSWPTLTATEAGCRGFWTGIRR